MKKIIANIALLVGAIAFFAACEDTTGGKSFVTEYAVLTLEGTSAMPLPMGTTYVEPGYTAVESGDDITAKVIVSGTVNHAKEGKYTRTYKVTNVDGFAKVERRTVGVYDSSLPLCGFYAMSIARKTGDKDSGARGQFYVLVYKGENAGEYLIEDVLGGWYRDGSGYGEKYAPAAVVKLNPDNTISLVSGGEVPGFGDAISGIASTSWDAATGTLKFTTDYAGMNFIVTAKKL